MAIGEDESMAIGDSKSMTIGEDESMKIGDRAGEPVDPYPHGRRQLTRLYPGNAHV
jgi:hypothetical protein